MSDQHAGDQTQAFTVQEIAEAVSPAPAVQPEAEEPKPRALIFESLDAPGIFPCFHCGAEFTDETAAEQDRMLDSLRHSASLAGWGTDTLGAWSCPACLPAHTAPPATLVPVSRAAEYRLAYDAYCAGGHYEDIDGMFGAPEKHASLGFDAAARHATSAIAEARREIAKLAADYQYAQETGVAA